MSDACDAPRSMSGGLRDACDASRCKGGGMSDGCDASRSTGGGAGDGCDASRSMAVELDNACDASELLDPRSSNGSGQNLFGRGVPPLSGSTLALKNEGKGGFNSREGLSVIIQVLQRTNTHLVLRVLPLGGYELPFAL